MITTYELKNRPCCRFFYKIPYFMKNVILLIGLAFIMVPIYLVCFRHESIGIVNIYKLIAGLNSRTFNYLETHKDQLGIIRNLKQKTVTGLSPQSFYSDCVSLSRACYLPDMAKSWPAS